MSIKIDNAFLYAFITTNSNFGFGSDVAHENIDYTPDPEVAYAELLNLPSDIEPLSLKDSNKTTGLFRVILRYPADGTAVVAKTKAEEIMAAFPIGSSLTYSGQKLTIDAVKRQPGFPEDGWYKITVTIGYVAFITR